LDRVNRSAREHALFAVGVNLANDAATAEIAQAMRAAGVRAILLKGPAVRHWLYGDASDRLSMDIDFLISWSQLETAERVLEELGYSYLGIDAVGADRPHCRVWEVPGTGTMLELHRRIAGIGAPSDVAWDVLSAGAEQIEVSGVEANVLSASARALHLALHAAQHGANHERTKNDLALALERVPADTWAEAAKLAERLDALPAFVAGLRLVPEGATLLDDLATLREMPVEVALRADSSPPLAEGLDWMSRLPVHKRAVFILRHLVPPAGYMRIWFPLARRSRAGLLLAYVWRPAWLLAHLPAAVLAWRTARKQLR
jgi:putative nucleotidyltransferase-like protein